MSKTIQLPTIPPVDIRVWEKSHKYFWAYNYDGCPKYGPFKSQQLAISDAKQFSGALW